MSKNELIPNFPDRGRRRYRAFSLDFDARAASLATEIQESWTDEVKELWRRNHTQIAASVVHQYGQQHADAKVRDFLAIGSKPFSVIAYHNGLFEQARAAFVAGAYFPALTGACALGERILNHLVLDLRDHFRNTAEYKTVHKKKSFNDWGKVIGVLKAWDVLLPDVADEFEKLATLRHRSLHFNLETYPNLRDDALKALTHMSAIVGRQFGILGGQPWFIEGIGGASYVKRVYETRPFVEHYLIPQCPFVGIRNAIEFKAPGIWFVDIRDYGEGDLTDEEFRDALAARNPASAVSSLGDQSSLHIWQRLR